MMPNTLLDIHSNGWMTPSDQDRPQVTRPAAALCPSLPFRWKQRRTVGWTHSLNITLLYLLFSEAACTQEQGWVCPQGVRVKWEHNRNTNQSFTQDNVLTFIFISSLYPYWFYRIWTAKEPHMGSVVCKSHPNQMKMVSKCKSILISTDVSQSGPQTVQRSLHKPDFKWSFA